VIVEGLPRLLAQPALHVLTPQARNCEWATAQVSRLLAD
jgi:hypothetical protein